MKKLIVLFLLPALLSIGGCKDLMKAQDDEKLSGDQFWNQGTQADVEAFTQSIYFYFRKATMVDKGFITATGDMRCAPIVSYATGTDYNYIGYLTGNDLNTLYTNNRPAYSWAAKSLSDWKVFYQVIQQANILQEEVGNVPGLSEQVRNAYTAEAVFMRCLTYFFLVRAFGDVPYYTNAYNSESLPRTNMVVVLKNCLAELENLLAGDPQAIKLPWTYIDNSKRGVRAMRGGAIALMMHINMWLAKFDAAQSMTYYDNTVSLGRTLLAKDGDVYRLVEIGQIETVFRGGSYEGLFEIAQNLNYNEVFHERAVFQNNVYINTLSPPRFYYTVNFLTTIFPVDEDDTRKELWFDEHMYNLDSPNTPYKMILKFLHQDSYLSSSGSSSLTTFNSGNQIVFRYADAILLYAEAAAMTGDEPTALSMLKMVRDRAEAETNMTLTGKDLQDAIYWERVRELFGEGHYFYDLVRTGKLCDRDYCPNSISRTYYNAGAWMLPIHDNAFLNNTKMTSNSFWD